MLRRFAAVCLAGSVIAVLAPNGAAAAVTKFPAAGQLNWSTVAVRKMPTTASKRMMTLYELRRDYRPQIVLAIGSKLVGYVPATHARLMLGNTMGGNALELRAREAGRDANTIRISISDAPGASDQDDLVIFIGGVPTFTFRYADGDVAALAGAINASSAPVRGTMLANGVPLTHVGPTSLSGGTDGNPGTLWYRLNLPIRPFGQKGWIPADAADVRPTKKRVVVRRNARVVEVYSGARRIFRARVAVGRPNRKTPLGKFYVAAKYRPPANALVSTYALELSAPAGLPDFLRGGVVGIHGTPAAWSIGKNVSNGCIRVMPNVALRLKRLVPLGTPVNVVR